MAFFDRLMTSVLWRVRLWTWEDWLRIGSKYVYRDPTLISPYVAKLIALGRYEKPERDLLAYMREHALISRGDRVLEAGGGLGTITMQIADIVGDDAVVTFEPNPRTANALKANLSVNGHRIAVKTAALVADNCSEVHVLDTIDTASFAVTRTLGAVVVEHAIVVPAEPISRVIAPFDPTVLVLDVEGAELGLLSSVDDWRRVRAVHLEVHPDVLSPSQIDAMFAHMQKAGFSRAPIPDFGANVTLLVREPGHC